MNKNGFLVWRIPVILFTGLALLLLGCPPDPEPEPTVTSVVVTPGGQTVNKGANFQFFAEVNGENEPAQTVTWSIITDNIAAGTTITDGGLLSVATGEESATLTIRATSTVDTSKYGDVVITVNQGGGTPLAGNVQITGTAKVGQTLTAGTSDFNASAPFIFDWRRANTQSDAGTSIGTNSNTYILTDDDEGKYIKVIVTHAGFSGEVISNVVGPIAEAGGTEPPSSQISVSFSGFHDEDIDLTADGNNSMVMQDYSQELTITINGDYDWYGWYLNGNFIDSSSFNYIITFNGGDFYSVGRHTITAVVKSGSSFYSKTLTIMVVEEN